ncbi:MAG: hypothetical protein GWP44_02310 [Proteobacteria bacterium]|nr:hypothetical protein [Pseudomonadota bacterium]
MRAVAAEVDPNAIVRDLQSLDGIFSFNALVLGSKRSGLVTTIARRAVMQLSIGILIGGTISFVTLPRCARRASGACWLSTGIHQHDPRVFS